MEIASDSGHATNCSGVAQGWLSSVLEVDLPSQAHRWPKAGLRIAATSKEVRALIFQMAAENPSWGAPRIHGELLKLGFEISEPTVSRWLQQAPRNPEVSKRWLTFLRNHREAIAAMDFFTVPTNFLIDCFDLVRRMAVPKESSARRRSRRFEPGECD